MSTPGSQKNIPLIATLLAVIAGAAFLLLLAQQESGRYFTKTSSLERQIKKAKPSGDHGYQISLPQSQRDDPRVVEHAIVLADGKPLPLRIEKIKHVGELGHGRYRVTARSIYLSTPDNIDPRSDGRTYEIKYPRDIRPIIYWLPLVLLAAALFLLQRHGLPRLPPWHLRPWVEPAAVLAISLVAMFWSLAHFSHHSDGWLIIDGIPFSDGMGWVDLAKSLEEGRGFNGAFEAHRGGYPILLGSIFSLTGGGSVLIAKLLNTVMLAFGATAIFLLVRSAFGRGLAWLILVGLLVGTRFGVLTQMTLTEPVGFALAAIGLQQFHRACLHPVTWRFLVVGIFLGLSNLVRPFTLLALPAFGAIILWIAWRDRWGWKRFATHGAAYVGGAVLIFAPWAVRQKLDWGVPTLDLNSAVMLYGAAQKPEGDQKQSLGARHYIEGDEAGFDRGDHGPRYNFYMGRFKEEVARDTGSYFAFLGERFVDFFEMPGLGDGHLREQLGAVFFAALVWLAWRRKIPPLVLLAGLWPMLADQLSTVPALPVVVIGAIISLMTFPARGRLAICILLATIGGAGALNSMVGNFALNRGSVFTEWILIVIVSSSIIGLARLAAGQRAESNPIENGKFSDRYPLAILGVFVLGFVLLIGKSAFTQAPDTEEWKIPDAVAKELRTEFTDIPADDLYIGRVRLGEYRWFAPAGRDFNHWAQQFEVQSYDRTIAMPLSGYNTDTEMAKSITLYLPGDQRDLPAGEDFIVIGTRNIDPDAINSAGKLVVQTHALVPYDIKSKKADTAKILRFSREGTL